LEELDRANERQQIGGVKMRFEKLSKGS